MLAAVMPAALLALASVAVPATGTPAPDPSAASAWQIGPIVRGRNYSVGMPLTPSPGRSGWHFDFPYPSARAGHVHYVTFNHGPLTGKRRIVVRYRVDAAPGVRFVPQEEPQSPATVSLVFQRRGDSWSGRGRYETYRWYAPGHTVMPIAPGEHVMTVSLDDVWTSVHGETAAAEPLGFRQAIDGAERIGLVFGSSSARGHGVYATGPARFTVTSFRVM